MYTRNQFRPNKNNVFRRLRFREYKKLFRIVKHSSRKSLLKSQPHQSSGEKVYSERKENEFLEDAEQIFHETFSNDFFNLMEDVLNSNSGMSNECDAIGIDSCQNNNVVSIEVCLLSLFIFQKNIETFVLFLFFCFDHRTKSREIKKNNSTLFFQDA